MNDRKIPAATIDKAKSDIVATVGKYVELQEKGSEFVACCPFHSERTPSFAVKPDKQFYYCFGCGASGDAIDFVSKFENLDFKEAVERIVGNISPQVGSSMFQRQAQKPQEAAEWTPVVPVPADIKQRPMDTFNRRKGDGWERLTSSKRWAYHDAGGNLLGYIYRFDFPEGGKDCIPQSYCVNKNTGEMSWRWLSFAKPRPLYGLDKLAKHPKAQVILAEGEKAADAAQALYEAAGVPRDKLVVISWPGGSKAVKHTDWTPLHGRSVGLWPDADQRDYADGHARAGQRMPVLEQPGVACMLEIAARLEGKAASLKLIEPPAGVPDSWDLADQLPPGFNLLAHTKAAAMSVDAFRAKHAPAQPDPVADLDAAMEGATDTPPWDDIPAEAYADAGAPVEQVVPDPAAAPAKVKLAPVGEFDNDVLTQHSGFTILGYDGGDYFLFSHAKRQVITIRKGDITDIGLIELAGPNFWEEFFSDGRGGINRKAVAHWIFSTAHDRGIYNPNLVRGRGAWTDNGRAVYHHGDYLTVDSQRVEVHHIQSGYVYPMARRLPEPAAQPLTDKEGAHLVSVAGLARWSVQASAPLMAGWVMLAPICGALPWRPHIWLSGGAGTGKTTLQKQFCGALTRGVHVYANGNSTEAGIRQELKGDALPCLIDEFESNNERERARVENIMSMIRQTSSETQAKTLKGTITGTGMHYDIRSMFCLASINTNLQNQADVDRLSILVLKPASPMAPDNWERLKAELNAIDMDTNISSRLLARALSLMPVILQAVEVFRRVAGKHFERQRDGDQYGTLLAGAWCLQRSHVPTEDDAQTMIEAYDWSEHLESHDEDDAMRALEAIMSAKIRVGTAGDMSVYELVRESTTTYRHGTIEQQVADDTLRRHGIRIDAAADELWFGTGVSSLQLLVKGTSFVTDLRGQLLRVKGARRLNKSKKFNGLDSKVVTMPLGMILSEEREYQGPPI